jgi:hypothetical protein
MEVRLFSYPNQSIFGERIKFSSQMGGPKSFRKVRDVGENPRDEMSVRFCSGVMGTQEEKRVAGQKCTQNFGRETRKDKCTGRLRWVYKFLRK